MVDEKFLEKLRDYFKEKYKAGLKWILSRYLRMGWHIITNWRDGIGVHELVDGRIEVYSNRVGDWEDIIETVLDMGVYRSELKKAKSEEERKRIWEKIRKEREEILNDLVSGKWEKYLEEK